MWRGRHPYPERRSGRQHRVLVRRARRTPIVGGSYQRTVGARARIRGGGESPQPGVASPAESQITHRHQRTNKNEGFLLRPGRRISLNQKRFRTKNVRSGRLYQKGENAGKRKQRWQRLPRSKCWQNATNFEQCALPARRRIQERSALITRRDQEQDSLAEKQELTAGASANRSTHTKDAANRWRSDFQKSSPHS